MAQLIADRRDIDFVLYEQLGIERLFKTPRYEALNRKMVDMIITELAVFEFISGQLTLTGLMPEESLEQVRAATTADFVEQL